jgi:hypothetical protein
VVASRANYARIKPVLAAVDEREDLELQTIAAASTLLERFGTSVEVMERDGFRPSALIRLIIEGETPTTMAKSTGLGLLELPTVFEMLQPDIVVTVADRFETIATTVAAAYMNLPVAHTQGGEVSGSIDESVRHAVTKLSHLYFPATALSAQRVVAMGRIPQPYSRLAVRPSTSSRRRISGSAGTRSLPSAAWARRSIPSNRSSSWCNTRSRPNTDGDWTRYTRRSTRSRRWARRRLFSGRT